MGLGLRGLGFRENGKANGNYCFSGLWLLPSKMKIHMEKNMGREMEIGVTYKFQPYTNPAGSASIRSTCAQALTAQTLRPDLTRILKPRPFVGPWLLPLLAGIWVSLHFAFST